MTSAQRDSNDYTHLTVLFAEMASLAEDDPDRDRDRTQIIEPCLPIASHIAVRYRGRGQTHDDLLPVASVVRSVPSTASTSTRERLPSVPRPHDDG